MNKNVIKLPHTVAGLMIQESMQTQKNLGATATPEKVEEAIRLKFKQPLTPLHTVERTQPWIASRKGIPYDFVKIPGGTAKGKFFLKPEMAQAEHFSDVCEKICDATTATSGDVLIVTDALYRQALFSLCSGERFSLHPFGELTVTLKAESIPDDYPGQAKDVSIKSVQLIPSALFLAQLNGKAKFTRRRIYADPVLQPELRKENILHALSLRPYLVLGSIAKLNNVSESTALRDINTLISQKKIYSLSYGRKKAYALYPQQ